MQKQLTVLLGCETHANHDTAHGNDLFSILSPSTYWFTCLFAGVVYSVCDFLCFVYWSVAYFCA